MCGEQVSKERWVKAGGEERRRQSAEEEGEGKLGKQAGLV